MKINWHKILTRLSPYSSLLGLIFVFLIFALHPDSRQSFLSESNFKIILTQTVVVAIGAIGMTMIIVSGGIDLSVGSSIALCGVVAAAALKAGADPLLALSAAVAVGVTIGLINGGLIVALRITPFIVTLGMLGIARGLAKWVAHNEVIYPAKTWINGIMQVFPSYPAHSMMGNLLETFPFLGKVIFAPGVYISLILALLMSVVMAKTILGRYIHAIGSNESTARICGINTGRMKLLIYGLAGAFFGLAGLMQMSRLQQGDPTIAIGLELDIIAAVIIGGASLSGGVGSIAGAMLGALMMVVLRNGTTQMGLPTYFQEIMIGCVIVIAVALERLRRR